MIQEILKDIEKSKTVTILGLTVLGASEFKNQLHDVLFKLLEQNKKECTIIAESDNQLFQHSLITDSASNARISFEELKIRRDFFFNSLNQSKSGISNSNFMVSSLHLPFLGVMTNNNIWYLPLINFSIDNYVKITSKNSLYNNLKEYFEYITDKDKGGKYSALKGSEMLELFDQNKVPRGIFPRNSFYGTDHFQYVIWGLVFNREGKLLIHKRKTNAKDNQNMWDKSIGGHIDFNIERSTHHAAVRELIEELYTEEKKQQSGHSFSMLSEDISKVYFLGDWRKGNFGPEYLDNIKLLEKDKEIGEENWVFYKIPNTISHNTPRILPDNKGERWLRVIVDPFIFITNTAVTDEYIQNVLKNSDYILIEPSTLKTWMDIGKDSNNDDFEVTPDLKYIMTGALRDIIDEVSLTIKYSDIRK